MEAAEKRAPRAGGPRSVGPVAAAPRPRVLHYPTDVGGNPSGLARAERRLGASSTVAVHHRSWLDYPVDIDLGIDPNRRFVDIPKRLAFLLRSIRRHDVFHFNFGQSFLPMVGAFGFDLPLLRLLGKKVFVTFQGCDARQTRFCGACRDREAAGLCTRADDRRKVRRIAHAVRRAHRVFVLNPDLLRVIPGAEFLPYASIDPTGVVPEPPSGSGRPTVLHAPTNREVKGTEFVLAARDALADLDVDWKLIEHVPHERALEMYAGVDAVVDQLRLGWYGGLGVELMAMGKPVVCYVREDDLRFLPPAMARELPVVRATPSTLTSVLRELLADPARLREIGARSRRYVERWHDPQKIARRLLEIYENPELSFWEGYDPDAAG